MASDRWVKLKFSVPGTVREDSRKAKDMVRKNTANILQKKDQGTEHFQDRCSELWTKQTNLLFASYCTQENNETCTSINYKKKKVISVSVYIPCENVHKSEKRLTKYLDHSRN